MFFCGKICIYKIKALLLHVDKKRSFLCDRFGAENIDIEGILSGNGYRCLSVPVVFCGVLVYVKKKVYLCALFCTYKN